MTAAVVALCAVGLFFSLSAAVGMLRMPDVYTRIQCSSKTVTMGAIPLLLGLAIAEGPVTAYGSRALLVALLLGIINPATGHALARAAYKTGVPMWSGAMRDDPHAAAADGAEQPEARRPGQERS